MARVVGFVLLALAFLGESFAQEEVNVVTVDDCVRRRVHPVGRP
jgi:hypothetical protein